MTTINRSDLSDYVGKDIRLEYRAWEEISEAAVVTTWVTSKFKLLDHNEVSNTVTFEDAAGEKFTWPTTRFRSIRTA